MRGFRAVYLGLFFNCFIMGMVTLAACKIANILFGLPPWQTILICGVLNVVFAAHSGLWGVLVIDMVQFFIKMTAVIAAAYFSLEGSGAPRGPRRQRRRRPASTGQRARRPTGRHARGSARASVIDGTGQPSSTLLPNFSIGELALMIFIMPDRHRLVGQLVSGRGAGRRQLHRPADARLEVREGRAGRERCSSTSRTTSSAPGRGSSPRCARSSSFRI